MHAPGRFTALALLGLAVAGGCAAPVKEAARLGDVRGRIPVVVDDRLTLHGTLGLPPGDGPFPAVVLMHGCSGPGRPDRGWPSQLNAWGYATLRLDSFGDRGIREVCTNRLLSPEDRLPDAFAALATLATHPRVDRERIVLMGFSHGGSVARLAAAPSIAGAYARPGVARFRASLAFYPGCARGFPDGRVGTPLRIHIGSDDDWTPAPPCEQFVAVVGGDVRITVYPGALHAFDAVGLEARVWRPGVGRGYQGATVGYSPEATAAARVNVRAELDALLR
ncbi:MAG: dienelactone hydrolase family protein [Candidatus Rokuibacteriota bacterium]